MSRKILYISGTRADYGLIKKTLLAIHNSDNLTLGICATGMHLIDKYGKTINEIESDSLNVIKHVKVTLNGTSEDIMSQAVGYQIIEFTKVISKWNPDIIMLLGDRGEMLAGAIAALHLNKITVHIHGGERSGTIDESIRHAISKIAHYHFVATKDSKARLIRMGEKNDHIFITGAPGLDSILSFQAPSKDLLFKKFNLCCKKKTALLLFHPVVQKFREAEIKIKEIIDCLLNYNLQIIAIAPNSDTGGDAIYSVYKNIKIDDFNLYYHIKRDDFLALMSHCNFMIGNSSSGIIESACFGRPVINIGDRQNQRIRNLNTIDIRHNKDEISKAIDYALRKISYPKENVYGDGNSSIRIVKQLKSISLSEDILEKTNAY